MVLATLAKLNPAMAPRKKASYELDEVHRHLWLIHGKYYDLKDFIYRHPGGSDQLLIAQGRECSAFFDSNHTFSGGRPLKVLEKYQVEPVDKTKDAEQIKASLAMLHPDPFYLEASKRVEEVLRANGIDPVKDRGADWQMTFFYLFIVTGLVTSIYTHWMGSLWGSFFTGVFSWHTFALGHNGAHWAVSKNKTINRIAQWPFGFLLAAIGYAEHHSFGHHCFTNDHTDDPDVVMYEPLLRVHPKSAVTFLSTLQGRPLYPAIIYALSSFLAAFGAIPQQLLRLVQSKREPEDWKKIMVASNAVQVLLIDMIYLYRPFVVHETWGMALLAIILPFTARSLYTGLFAQVAHKTELCMHPAPLPANLKNSWAAKQCVTSSSYCTDSVFWNLASNHLNMQVEHHLFPALNECHLHLITPVVKEVCAKYGVQAVYYDSFWDLLVDHYMYLRRMGLKAI